MSDQPQDHVPSSTSAKSSEDENPLFNLRVPRWVKLALIPGFAGPLLILGFIFVTELAHDEKRCPFTPVSQQELAPGVQVREDRRSCLPNVEERRYTVVRGDQTKVLGRRRFAPAAFQVAYRWSARVDKDAQVHVAIHNDGHDDAEFREGLPDERVR